MNMSRPPELIFNLVDIAPKHTKLLTPIAATVRDRLTDWFQQDDFLAQAAIPFGATKDSNSWVNNALNLKQQVLDGDYSARLEVRSSTELQGALGAYSATGTTGQPTVYLNGDWLSAASTEHIQSVLLEELGHSFDNQINSGIDSAGDEGAIFSALVQGIDLDANQLAVLRAEDDTNVISLDGQELGVEQAIAFDPASPLWKNLARTGDPNKAVSDGTWTANSSDLVGDSTTPYLQIQADGTTIAFKVLAEPQSGDFKALMGIFVDVDGDGSPDLTIQVNVGNVTNGYAVLEYDFIPIVKGITADANTRPNNTVIPASNTGTYYGLKEGSLTNPSNFRVYGPAARVGSNGVVELNVDGDSAKENYYVFSFTLAQLNAFRNLVANNYNGGVAGSVYKEIPQWPSDPTKIYAAGLTASNSLNAVNGDIGGGPYSTSSSWQDIFGFQPPLPPIAANDIATVLEDSALPVTGNLLANDTDANNDVLRVTQFVVSGTTYTLDAGTPSRTLNLASGTLIVNRDGAYSFQPAPNYAGPVPLVTYTVSDGALTTTATLSISITPVNDAPDGANKTVTLNEDSTYTFAASNFGFTDANDSPANSLQSIVITTLPTAGTLTLNGAAFAAGTEITAAQIPLLVYTPAANGSGTSYANFTFQVRDNGGTASGGINLDPTPNTITVNVTPINDAPIAIVDTATAVEAGGTNNGTAGTNPSGNVVTNDTDVDAGDTKTVTSVLNAAANSTGIPAAGSTSGSSPATVTGQYGSLAIGADGSYVYTVNNSNATVQALRLSSNTLTETFTYTVRDAAGAASTNTLTVTVQGANDAPTAVNDFNIVTGTAAALPSKVISGNILTNDTDVDGNGETKAIQGTRASANGSSSSTITTITLNSVAGITTNDYVLIDGSTTNLKDASNNNIQVLSISGTTVTLSGGGTVTSLTNGTVLRFATNAGGTGSQDTATLQSFASSGSNIINVSAVNGTIATGMVVTGTDSSGNPFARNVTAVNNTNGTITVDGAPLTVSSTTPALSFTNSLSGTVNLIGKYGTLNLNAATGDYTYTPNSGLAAGNYADNFNYTMQDAAGAPGSATLTINVQVQSTPPTAVADSVIAVESGGTANATAGSNPAGNVVLGTGSTGNVADTGTGLSVLTAWASTTSTETSVATGTTIAGQYGTLTISSNGSYSYAANNNNPTVEALRTSGNTLTEKFFYRLANSGGQTDVTTLTVTIQGANDNPAAVADATTATEAGGTSNNVSGFNPSGNVLLNDTDKDAGDTKIVARIIAGSGAPTTAVAANTSVVGIYGTLVINPDGSYSYTVNNGNTTVNALAAGQSVADTFTYEVRDTAGGAHTTSLTITVNGANDAPINTVPALLTTAENTSLAIASISISDPENAVGQTISSELASVQLAVANGQLSIGNLNGATISSGSNNSATLTLAGSQEQINLALATLSYQGNPSFSGADALTVTATDGLGLQAVNTIPITVNPDNRVLTVTSPTVNEGSPYAVFTVDGAPDQLVSLTLTAGTAIQGSDFSPNLEYWNGSAWVEYAGTPATIPNTLPGGAANPNGLLLVRTAILDDAAFEGPETFTLTATNRAGTAAVGTAAIADNGTGLTFDINGVSDGTIDGAITKDDDRLLTVSSPTVNEASPYAIFSVGGAANQWVKLSLNDGTATAGTDYGTSLVYWNGTGWTTYTTNTFIQIPAGGTLLVRTGILQDGVYEGSENFALTATNTGGTSTQGLGTITDDGTGVKYPGTVTGGSPDIETTNLDSDLSVSVVAATPVNEASPYALFTVTGTAGQNLFLTLGNTVSLADQDATITGFTLEYSYDGTTWLTYSTGDNDYSVPVIPGTAGQGVVYVRATINSEADTLYEGPETFTLKADIITGATATSTGIATIVDDGTGTKFPGTVTGGIPDAVTTALDDDRLLTMTSPTVTEGTNPYAIFTVNGVAGQTVSLAIAGSGANPATAETDGVLNNGEDFGNGGLEYSLDGGTTWLLYTGGNVTIPAGGNFQIRTSIAADSLVETAETFSLTATYTSGGTKNAVGIGTIQDGNLPVTVSSPTVNEASPYAIFSVGGIANQQVTLSLANGTATGAGTDFGPALQYWDGTAWVTYTANALVPISGNGTLLVRTTIANDGTYEGAETFTLTAINTGGTGTTGTGTIVDNGTGVKYPGTVTGGIPDTATTALDDDRPLTVSSPTVNEASPYAIFSVGGVANQQVTLSLANGTATGAGTDFGPALQYWDGTNWLNYTANVLVGIPAGGTLLVRTAIVNDGTYEGAETFTLTATNTGGTGTTGTGTIVDDGTGTKFPGTVTGGIPDTATTNLDDDRSLTVSSPTVNEASPYAIFSVGGIANQQVTLTLANGTATGAGTDFGPGLQYWDGTDWVTYTANALVGIPAGGTLLVRTAIVNDGTYEGAETFTLTATNTGGTGTTGTGTIVDDGTGTKFPGTVTGGSPDTATTNRDDDRPLTVSSPTVNEASPYAIFSVGGVANQQVTLNLANGTAIGTDYGPGLQYWDGTNWLNYTANALVPIPGNGTLLVRTTIVNDGTYEGAETFTLTATNTGGTGTTGTGTIVDNGTGVKYPGAVTGGIPDTATTALDDDRPLTVSSPTVNEASPYAIFSVGGVANQQVTLTLANGSATGAGTDFGSGLEYWNGTAWVTYTANNLVPISGNGTLLVRTAIVNDGVYEGAETFTLTATNTGGTSTTGTGTIVDDGTGIKYLGTVTGGVPDTVTTNLDDDRPLTVSSPTVNEASPYTIFSVGGVTNQQVTLSLANGTAIGTDYGPGLQYWDGTNWLNYTANALVGIPAGGTLLVRTTIVNDGVYEGAETFTLTATNTGGTRTTGTGTIVDDGTGIKFPGTVTGGIPDTATTNLDDDRPLTVNSPTVNEASPYAVFTVGGVANQQVTLSLANGTATGAGTDFGPGLQYWDGTNWVTYTANALVGIPAGGTLLVRTAIVNDGTYEGAETFTLTATNTGGTGTTGTGTILDDGTGTKFPGTVTGGIPDTATTNLDDDRPLSVSSPTVNEASPYAIFSVEGVANQQVTLSLANGTAIGADYGPALEYWNGTTWVSYTANALVGIPAGGTLLVRTAIVNDGTYEGAETFILTATNTGGTGTTGTGTIVDDGTGIKYPGTVTGGTPDTVTTALDDDRPLTVSSPTVNEASPYAIFSVGGVANQQVTLSLTDGTATGADYGPALEYWNGTTWVSYTANALVDIPAGGTLLVRTAIINDGTYEGTETFTLTATNTGGTGTTGTGTIIDNGTGIKFPGTVTGGIPDTATTNLDDDRPLTVSSITVNEASPYAIFSVGGVANQQVTLTLANGSATGAGTDFGPGLQYWDGTNWLTYTANALVPISGNGTLLVRTAIVNDGTYEGAETFTLTATNTGGTGTTGTGTIVDNGTGTKFPGTLTNGIPDTATTALDDDRPLTVSSPTVNEASPYAIFSVGGVANQQVTLSLANGSATGAGTDFGPGLQYWDGTDWLTYTANALVGIPAGSTLLVRTAIVNDGTYEGAETFTLTATNTGGTGTTGTGTIVDDGTGIKHPGTVTNGSPDTATTNLDDDRPLTVSSPTVNESSPYAVFTVGGVANQQVTLSLANGSATGAGTDFGPALQYWDGTNWLTYTANTLVPISGNGTLLVRTTIANDGTYEIAETFTLTATNTGGTGTTGTGTIVDNGTGTKFPGTVTNGIPDTATTALDDDRPLTVSSPTVNEASPYAIFSVGGVANQQVALSLANGSATGAGTDYGPGLQYWDGTNWLTYTANALVDIPAGGTLLVRTTIVNDGTYEGAETFTLTATNTGGTGTTGTGTIVDNGTGTKFPGTVTNGIPDAATTALDDDRPLIVSSPTVNEASPYAIFSVGGIANQQVTLSLANGSATGAGTDFGPALQYWDGTNWLTYTANTLVPISGNGTLLVRTAIVNDGAYEGAETFTLTATNTGGTGTTGTGTIVDNGTGIKFPGTVTGGIPDTATTALDDDRPLTVSSPTVNEGINAYAVFTVTGLAGQTIALGTAGAGINPATKESNATLNDGEDFGNGGLEYSLDGGTTWLPYTGGNVTVPGGGNVQVRTSITADSLIETAETFSLTATYTSGGTKNAVGTGTIQDGNGSPVAVNDTNSISEDAIAPVNGGVLLNDTDPDSATLSVVAIQLGATTATNPAQPLVGSYGSLTWASDGSYSYSLNNTKPAVQALTVGQSLSEVFTYTVSDGSGGSDTATLSITINGTNDAPVLDLDSTQPGTGYVAVYDPAVGAKAIAPPTLTITDIDDPTLASVTFTLGNRLNGSDERLVVGPLPSGITASAYDPTTGTLTLKGVASLSAYQSAIAAVAYENTALFPNRQNRTVDITLSDGKASSNTATTLVQWTGNGTNGNDIIYGVNPDGSISGLSNPDIFYGYSGDDIITGGSDTDVIFGGLGNDIISAGGGNDSTYGEAGSDVLNGGSGNDYLDGGTEDDVLSGGSGNDWLIGGTGADVLNGGSGNDVLIGGAGSDLLIGGLGTDKFKYQALTDGLDTIRDFEIVGDRIDLSAIGGLGWSNVQRQQSGLNTLLSINAGGQTHTLATLLDVNANTITSQHFLFTA